MSKRNLFDAWTRFGKEVLDPMKMTDWMRAPTKMAGEVHDAWLESVGGVSRAKYVAVLEENLRLRRKLDELQERKPLEDAAETAAGAMDDAFQQMRSAQEQWLNMWMPKKGES